jgi:outer membrane protein, heavy metal efflux system
MKTTIVLLSLVSISICAYSQSGIDAILNEIEQNNKSIQSDKKYWEAQKLSYKTGLTPYDPQMEYDYLYGTPVGAGNQKDFSLTQRFDFPTVYRRRKDLSREQTQLADLQIQSKRQDVLLEAKIVALQLIYLNRKDAQLQQRLNFTKQLEEDYRKKYEAGEAIILDLNKIKLQLLNIHHDVLLNRNEIALATTRLTEFNGGKQIAVHDTTYPAAPDLPAFEMLDSIIEANDPILKVYEQQSAVGERAIAVQRALSFPKIEAGYHSQGILGQSYRGVHGGITIPLWENKNRVKTAQADLAFSNVNKERHITEHRLENKRYYDQLAIRLSSINQYKDLLSSLNNEYYLKKALQFGQITVIQYVQEESYFNAAYDRYLLIEWEYQQAMARLLKYRL